MQAENPKQQYLLLRALNEVITSLTGDASLPDRQQDEVSLHHLLPAHMILVGLAFAPINELSLACHCMFCFVSCHIIVLVLNILQNLKIQCDSIMCAHFHQHMYLPCQAIVCCVTGWSLWL